MLILLYISAWENLLDSRRKGEVYAGRTVPTMSELLLLVLLDILWLHIMHSSYVTYYM